MQRFISCLKEKVKERKNKNFIDLDNFPVFESPQPGEQPVGRKSLNSGGFLNPKKHKSENQQRHSLEGSITSFKAKKDKQHQEKLLEAQDNPNENFLQLRSLKSDKYGQNDKNEKDVDSHSPPVPLALKDLYQLQNYRKQNSVFRDLGTEKSPKLLGLPRILSNKETIHIRKENPVITMSEKKTFSHQKSYPTKNSSPPHSLRRAQTNYGD